LMTDMFENLKKIAKVRCPVFLVHGTKDNIVPVKHSQKLSKAIPEKYLWKYLELPSANHRDIEVENSDDFLDEFVNFIQFLKPLEQKSANKNQPLSLPAEFSNSPLIVVNTWLKSLNLEQYTDAFLAAGFYDLFNIATITETDLDLIGIANTSDRNMILERARELKDSQINNSSRENNTTTTNAAIISKNTQEPYSILNNSEKKASTTTLSGNNETSGNNGFQRDSLVSDGNSMDQLLKEMSSQHQTLIQQNKREVPSLDRSLPSIINLSTKKEGISSKNDNNLVLHATIANLERIVQMQRDLISQLETKLKLAEETINGQEATIQKLKTENGLQATQLLLLLDPFLKDQPS